MKVLILILLGFVIAGCTMDHDEYVKRVEFCEQKGLKASVTETYRDGRVVVVSCFDEQGNKFRSGDW